MTPGLWCLDLQFRAFSYQKRQRYRDSWKPRPRQAAPSNPSQSGILPLPEAGRPQAPPPREAWLSVETPVWAGLQGAPLTRRCWDE